MSANGHTKGTAGVYFALSSSGAESLEAFTTGLMFNYERNSGKEIDYTRTRIHNFSGSGVQGKMVAVFHTGKPYVRK